LIFGGGAFWSKNGYSTARLIKGPKFTPSIFTYTERFGSLLDAFRAIGYRPTHGSYHCDPSVSRPLHRKIVYELISIPRESRGNIRLDDESQKLELRLTALPT
jgi:hypothetical protein